MALVTQAELDEMLDIFNDGKTPSGFVQVQETVVDMDSSETTSRSAWRTPDGRYVAFNVSFSNRTFEQTRPVTVDDVQEVFPQQSVSFA